MISRRIQIVVASMLLLSTSIARAQDNTDLPLYVNTGDKLLIAYSHDRNRNGESVVANVSAEVEIGQIFEETFLASWTTHSMEIGGFVIDDSNPQAGEVLLGVPVEFLASADGTPLRISDKDELLETVFNSSFFKSQDAEGLARVETLFNSMTEDVLAQIFLKIPTYMAICQGTSLPLGEENSYQVEVPSPIGGEPADSVVTYELQDVNDSSGLAHIEYRMTLEPESARRMTVALLQQMGVGDDTTEQEFAGLMIERNDSASCGVNVESGWVEAVTFVTETKIADQFRSETFEISIDHYPAAAE